MELIRLSESIRATSPPNTSVECFRDPLFVYQYAYGSRPDALFAVADMKRLTGFNIAKQLRARDPSIQVFIIWDNDDYRADAIRAGADGYLIRPVTAEALRRLETEIHAEGGGEAG